VPRGPHGPAFELAGIRVPGPAVEDELLLFATDSDEARSKNASRRVSTRHARVRTPHWSSQPLVSIFLHEGVVVQMGISAVDAIDLLNLSRGKFFSGIQTPAPG